MFRAARKMAVQPASNTPRPQTPPSHTGGYVPPDDDDDLYDNGDPYIRQDRSPSPSADLLKALEALTLTDVRLQKSHRLPFLVRNVREAFKARCQALQIATTKSATSSEQPTEVRLRYRLSDGDEFMGRMVDWLCPLCKLFGSFSTREMLDAHLKWDHPNCDINWDAESTRNVRF